MSLSGRRVGWLVPAALGALGIFGLAVELAGLLPPPALAELTDSLLPPLPLAGSIWTHPLGTDAQGRDMLVVTLDGARLSLAVAALGVAGALLTGLGLGLIAGQAGGVVDALLMRVADVQLTFPALLVALLADAAYRIAGMGPATLDSAPRGVFVLGFAIALGRWPPIARVMRAATRREWRRDYVTAARLAGAGRSQLLVLHVLPNAVTSVMPLVALDVGFAIMDEATLSYLGLGLPPNRPSLGTLVRAGQEVMMSGAWWVVLVPGALLVLLVASATASADGLTSANPGAGLDSDGAPTAARWRRRV